jgi:hypothetical protein
MPSLAHLSNEELGALRSKLSSAARDARRKATLTIQKSPSLSKPYTKSLSIDKKAAEHERAEIMAIFERELLRVPEAYVAHAFANSLVLLDGYCKEELTRRVGSKPKKQAAPPAPAPVPAPPVPQAPPPPAPEAPVEELSGMDLLFQQAERAEKPSV